MRTSIFLCFVFMSASAFTQVDQKLPNGRFAYYGEEFETKFPKITKEIIVRVLNASHNSTAGKPDVLSSNCISNCYSHTSVGYDGARKILFGELFIKKNTEGTYVEDVYCQKRFFFKNVTDISNMGNEVNIEHTWPQSKFNTSIDKNIQKSDMHHLYPTDSDANNRRGNFQFGDAANHADQLNVQDCSVSKLSRISDYFIFMPPTTHRGNVARSLFYFAAHYKMTIGPAEELILRQWHKSDPVDEAEKARHEVIAKYQKVRNPFVDYPGLVEKVSDF
jgi:deoxyribonuclease-1